ncbi:MAG: HNH endonuclease [Acidobacteria bacterium]|nr:HNH endonuclease [Acidobacteriota bacterium]
MDDLDTRIRLKAFSFLEDLASRYGSALSRELLGAGFDFDGKRVPLISPQGIFKPALLPEIPISITTAPVVEGKARPYADEIGSDGLMRYKYRGEDPKHRDNIGLRLAMQRHLPLIYFYGLVPGKYAAVWPVYIVGDDPKSLTFSVEIGEKQGLIFGSEQMASESVAESVTRSYVTVSTQRRLHQQSFRMRVLEAYHQCCAVCRLRHAELLDAAHILPDGHPKGEPWVSNGISLCKLHHAAFDSQILGIRPDLVVEIRKDILEESDGPLLIHGLKEWHNKKLIVIPHSPRLKPRTDFLEERFVLFRQAS